jgi:hypothetical protein
MYSLKIDENQIKRLYELREYLKEKGYKATIAGLVREMINDGLEHYDGIMNVNGLKEPKDRRTKKDWRTELEMQIRDRNRELNKKLY